MELTDSVGSVTRVIIPCSKILLSLTSIFSWSLICILCCACWNGGIWGSVTKLYPSLMFPITSEHFGYFFFSSVTSVMSLCSLVLWVISDSCGRTCFWLNQGAKFLKCSEYAPNWSHAGCSSKIWSWWSKRKNCDVMSFYPGSAMFW